MPSRTRRPKFDPELVSPDYVVRLGSMRALSDGTVRASLILPDIPAELIEEVGSACALAILGVLKWPNDKAARLADRVKEDLQIWAARNLDDLKNPRRPPQDSDIGDFDDDVPF